MQDVTRKTPKIHLRFDKLLCEKWHLQRPAVTQPCFLLLGSDSSTVEIHISSKLRGYEDVDADEESLENSVKH